MLLLLFSYLLKKSILLFHIELGISQVLLLELSGTAFNNLSSRTSSHLVFGNLVKGTGDFAFVLEKLLFIILGKVNISVSRAVVSVPSNSLESLQASGGIRERA